MSPGGSYPALTTIIIIHSFKCIFISGMYTDDNDDGGGVCTHK